MESSDAAQAWPAICVGAERLGIPTAAVESADLTDNNGLRLPPTALQSIHRCVTEHATIPGTAGTAAVLLCRVAAVKTLGNKHIVRCAQAAL